VESAAPAAGTRSPRAQATPARPPCSPVIAKSSPSSLRGAPLSAPASSSARCSCARWVNRGSFKLRLDESSDLVGHLFR
jgi:hypothetical protein